MTSNSSEHAQSIKISRFSESVNVKWVNVLSTQVTLSTCFWVDSNAIWLGPIQTLQTSWTKTTRGFLVFVHEQLHSVKVRGYSPYSYNNLVTLTDILCMILNMLMLKAYRFSLVIIMKCWYWRVRLTIKYYVTYHHCKPVHIIWGKYSSLPMIMVVAECKIGLLHSMAVHISITTCDTCPIDHMVRTLGPSPSIFAYCKHKKLEARMV